MKWPDVTPEASFMCCFHSGNHDTQLKICLGMPLLFTMIGSLLVMEIFGCALKLHYIFLILNLQFFMFNSSCNCIEDTSILLP